MKTELWAVLYLHDWDPSGKVYPEIHTIHGTWQEAEAEKRHTGSPDKYWVRRCRVDIATLLGDNPIIANKE